jgi:hypothetical protein
VRLFCRHLFYNPSLDIGIGAHHFVGRILGIKSRARDHAIAVQISTSKFIDEEPDQPAFVSESYLLLLS